MADTWGPYRAAYTIAALVYAGYALSIWWRAKRVRERREKARDLLLASERQS
jgi:hypothetical protein